VLLLNAYPVLDPEEVAEVARVVAFALTRVHAGGLGHGAVDVDHLLVGDDGLVSLAPSRPPEGAASPAGDVRALGELIVELLGSPRHSTQAPAPKPRWPRRRRRASLMAPPSPAEALAEIARQANPEEGSTPPSAATIAAQIALRVPGARPPGRRPPSPDRALGQAAVAVPARPPSRVGGAVFAVALVVLLAIAGAAAATLHGRSSAPPEVVPTELPPSTTTLASRVWPAGDFAIGDPDDVVLTGDWLCRDEPVPALLRPATGQVYVFDRWPSGDEELPGRLVGTVLGAVRLVSVTDPDHPCPHLVAERADGSRVEVPTP
jgi:hypothetical protein